MEIYGKVFSSALDEPWIDILYLKRLESTSKNPKDKTDEDKDKKDKKNKKWSAQNKFLMRLPQKFQK